MTYSNADSALEDPSTALLALKRFIRNTLRQVGIGLVSLMVVLNLGTHAPERSPNNTAELTAEPTHSTSQPVFSQSAHSSVPAHSLTAFASQPLASHPTVSESIERRIGRGITDHHFTGHHFTGARLSITTASEPGPEQAIVSVAKAG